MLPMSASAQPLAAPELVQTPRPLIIAHRGYSAIAPENTLPAFRMALATGADLVELDYYHSKDGVPIVLHDANLDRTTDAISRWGSKGIHPASRDAAELLSLDAGSWFDPAFANTRLPALTAALELIQGKGGVTLIERKEGDPATVVKLLRERNWINRVVVQSFDWQYLREFHALAPEQVLGALGVPKVLADGRKPPERPKTLSAAWLDDLQRTGARLVVWNREITADAVALAHQRGLKVWVYTINDPQEANRLLDLGVDGLITDNPGLLWRTLALRQRKP